MGKSKINCLLANKNKRVQLQIFLISDKKKSMHIGVVKHISLGFLFGSTNKDVSKISRIYKLLCFFEFKVKVCVVSKKKLKTPKQR